MYNNLILIQAHFLHILSTQQNYHPFITIYMPQKNIHGYIVNYKNNALKGAEHLAYVLSYDEAFSLFQAAQISGNVKFEDRVGRNFTLKRKTIGTFLLKKRSGW